MHESEVVVMKHKAKAWRFAFAMVLSVCLVFTMVPSIAWAEGDAEADGEPAAAQDIEQGTDAAQDDAAVSGTDSVGEEDAAELPSNDAVVDDKPAFSIKSSDNDAGMQKGGEDDDYELYTYSEDNVQLLVSHSEQLPQVIEGGIWFRGSEEELDVDVTVYQMEIADTSVADAELIGDSDEPYWNITGIGEGETTATLSLGYSSPEYSGEGYEYTGEETYNITVLDSYYEIIAGDYIHLIEVTECLPRTIFSQGYLLNSNLRFYIMMQIILKEQRQKV